MANGSDPIQQFIQNHMAFQGFMEEQRQFGMQAAMQQRQIENQEIQNFVGLAQHVQRPEELGSLATFFAQRNPEMAPMFEGLMANMAPSVQAQQRALVNAGMQNMDPEMAARLGEASILQLAAGQTAGQFAVDQTVAGLPPEAIGEAVAIQQGRAMSAPQQVQAGLQQQGLNLDVARFNESVRQHGIDTTLRQMGLDLQSRGLDLQGAQLAQQGELGQLGIMQNAGLLPLQLQSQLSTRINELGAQMQSLPADSPERRRIAQEIADSRQAMETLGTVMQASMAGGRSGAAGGLSVDDLPGMIETQRKLIADIAKAKSDAERTAIQQNYDAVTQLINTVAPGIQAQPLGDPRNPVQKLNDWIGGFFTGGQ